LRDQSGPTKLVGPFAFMLQSPNIERTPDGSLCLSQGASFERGLCLMLGFAALVFCVSLGFEGLPINEVDALAFTAMFGFFIGALILPSSSARFDAQTQTLSYQRDKWGYKQERTFRFSEIESIKRMEVYEAEETGVRLRFRLVAQGRELLLLPNSLLPEQAKELEELLRALLPECPINTSTKPNPADNQLSLKADGDLKTTEPGISIVSSSATFTRIMCLLSATFFLLALYFLAAGLETFQKVGFGVAASGFFLGACLIQRREWRFDSGQKQVVLLEERAGFKKKRVFDFADVREIRRESYVVELDGAPLCERFRLFLQIGEADVDLVLSPKDLTRAQADELERAVCDVLGISIPATISGTDQHPQSA